MWVLEFLLLAQFEIKYCFLILRNVYSSKKRVDFEFNSISLKKMMDPVQRNIFRKCHQHLRD